LLESLLFTDNAAIDQLAYVISKGRMEVGRMEAEAYQFSYVVEHIEVLSREEKLKLI
ncbi:hypothetical protein KIL84_012743, partial [Mauremys mutica]